MNAAQLKFHACKEGQCAIPVDVHLRAVCYPLGFPVNLTTNSPDVLRAAEESWGSGGMEFEARPLRIRVMVGAGPKAADPVFHIEGHLFSIVSGRENYAVADLNALFAWCRVTAATVTDSAWFRWFFLDALILSLLAQRHTVPVHAGCVAREGSGVLLLGPSGAGKSTLSWACAREGWSFVGDDAAWLLPESEQPVAVGRPRQVRLRPDATRHFPELASMAAHARPNGKMSIEIRTRDFPGVRTASHAQVERVVFLERRDSSPGLIAMPKEDALEGVLRDCVPYRDEVHARHIATVRKLAALPAFRLQYRSLDEALELLRC